MPSASPKTQRTTPHDLPSRTVPSQNTASQLDLLGQPQPHPALAQLAKTIKKHCQLILNAVEHGPSNARTEATNTHLRLLTRRAYGYYYSPESLIAMADLTRGGLYSPLPERSWKITHRNFRSRLILKTLRELFANSLRCSQGK